MSQFPTCCFVSKLEQLKVDWVRKWKSYFELFTVSKTRAGNGRNVWVNFSSSAVTGNCLTRCEIRGQRWLKAQQHYEALFDYNGRPNEHVQAFNGITKW